MLQGRDRGRTQLFARVNESLFVMSYTMIAAAAPAAPKPRVRRPSAGRAAAITQTGKPRTSVVHWSQAVVPLLARGVPGMGSSRSAIERGSPPLGSATRTKSRT